jgi:hypothetical protein
MALKAALIAIDPERAVLVTDMLTYRVEAGLSPDELITVEVAEAYPAVAQLADKITDRLSDGALKQDIEYSTAVAMAHGARFALATMLEMNPTLNAELRTLDAERVGLVTDVLADQVAAGMNPDEFISETLAAEYPGAAELADEITGRLVDSARDGNLNPFTAVDMARGARFALSVMIEYADAEAFDEQFRSDGNR